MAKRGGFLGVTLDSRLSGTRLPAGLAPQVGLEPTTLRLASSRFGPDQLPGSAELDMLDSYQPAAF